MKKELLRKLPKIDEMLKLEAVEKALKDTSRTEVVDNLRNTIDAYRGMILDGSIEDFTLEDIVQEFTMRLEKSKTPHLRPVINATGIIIHTNLGRSLLCRSAIQSVTAAAANYSNLEYNLEAGERGSRYSHIEEIIKKVTGAEAAMVVNNNAAAVMLVLDTLCRGKEAIVSRGQLVEIGGSFRIPEVMRFSGAKLVEVGTTNRTHLYDYENNISENTGVLLKVHTSNFKIMGFTKEVSIEELVELGEKSGIPVVEDIGSGVLIDFSKYGFVYEPTVQESVRKGIDVITFSGDKMLGGPQAGIIIGKKVYIDSIKKNQLTRALRVDKMTLAALEATMKMYIEEETALREIPTLNMILSPRELHEKRAQRLKERLQNENLDLRFSIKEDYSMVGGGSMPTEKIGTFVIAVKSKSCSAAEMESMLRANSIPIIVRISNDDIIMDMRTLRDEDFNAVAEAFRVMER
jgi:L-seryl-tRNA(Ser) seleniumtransferase